MNAQRILTLQDRININNGSYTYDPNVDRLVENPDSSILAARKQLPNKPVEAFNGVNIHRPTNAL